MKKLGKLERKVRHNYVMHTEGTSFYRATACNATHGIAVAILSVHPSVRQTRVL